MRRAPLIDKSILQNAPATNTATEGAQAVPTVSDMLSRMGNVVGSKITLPVCGRDVMFTLKVIPAERVEKSTMVWAGNERQQGLLNERSLDDLLPSFIATGQQQPAFGRDTNGITEVADGSRRRAAAIITGNSYRVLIGNLDDEQMAALSELGNKYRPTSAYERGLRYQAKLPDYNGEIKALAEAEGVDRKTVYRCLYTAKLPMSIMRLFSHPGELSGRAGEALGKLYEAHPERLESGRSAIEALAARGEDFPTERIIKVLTESALADQDDKPAPKMREFAKGIKAKYRGNNATFELKDAPSELVKKIEKLLEQYGKENNKDDKK